jgi:SAM-dependent methyltransferase
MSKEIDSLDSIYWNSRFEGNDTPWDLGQISPPLSDYFDQIFNRNLSVLIPGCGNAWEAQYLLEKGFTNITLIDISSVATQRLREKFQRYHSNLSIITDDFFSLTGQFDLIVEQTFFCALSPVLRTNYVQKMASLLSSSGKLAGVLFNRQFEGGPPFGGLKDEYESLFSSYLDIYILADCYNSAKPRRGTELFFIAGSKT